MPLVVVTAELAAVLAECPRGGRLSGDVFAHAYRLVMHGTVWLGPDDGYGPSCSAAEVVWQLPERGWPQWTPTVRQHAYDRQTRRGRGR